ncbi:MAG: MFS transporter [Promethearchaeota archaeon]
MKKSELYTVIVFVIIASLDNAALALIPAIMTSIAEGIGVAEEMSAILSFIVATLYLVTAVTSFIWGYWGDKYSRKKLMIYGTIIWVIFIFLSTFAQNFVQLFILQFLSGIGLGCIASVGFSIIIDFISPQRRGLALSFWGISQGVGAGMGYMLSVIFNVQFGWNSAFLILSIITIGFIVAYLFTVEPERGATEEELQDLFKSKKSYDYRINKEDLRYILKIKTNKYLIFQGLFAYISIGGLMLLPTVFFFKITAVGVPEVPAKVIGPFLAGIFEMGYGLSFLFGWLGDRYQKKTLKGRSIVSAVAVLIGVPLSIVMVLIPINFIGVPNTDELTTIIAYINSLFFTNPAFLLAFIISIFAAIFISAIDPNFFALIGDANLPEHRGTLFGFANLISGIGRSIGLIILPGLQLLLGSFLPLDMSWTLAFIFTLLFFIPTGICFIYSIRSAPSDIRKVKKILLERAKARLEDKIQDGSRDI